MKLLLTKNQFIKSFIYLAIILLVLFLINLPLYKKASSLVEKFQLQKSQSAGNLSGENSLEKNLNIYKDISDDLPPLAEEFNQGGNELELITELENLADDNDLNQIIKLESQPKDFSQQLQTLGLSLEVSGDYNNFIKYLHELSLKKPRLKITGIDIVSGQSNSVTANISTITYWLK